MNPDIARLQPYPFQKLAALKEGITPPAGLEHIALSIGEPRHEPPAFVAQAVTENLDLLSVYPGTKGVPELRGAIADWLGRRFRLPPGSVDAEHNVLPVNGTREALFAFAQSVVDRSGDPLVAMPNPFYQIYEGAALLAGAEPWFLDCREENGFLPDFDAVPESVWQRCQLIYVCSPGNPTGAVLGRDSLRTLIGLADRHDFIIAADECYSEIYLDEADPPVGLLQVCAEMGRDDFHRCVVFHSLSKRSNVPGLRSGFVAGDAQVLERFFLYRTYHGCAMPPFTQQASIQAWSDEAHVRANRELYRRKFDAVLEILGPVLEVRRPQAGFYLWAKTPIADDEFARGLFAARNVTVLPGSYLSRTTDGGNPGRNRVRMALVAPHEQCLEAAGRIRDHIENLL
jgi:N-succinyldiaminopimelate aminotransferase